MFSNEIEALRASWRQTPHVWGRSDCILSVCDHVLAQTGIDPAAPWRGTYDDERGAQQILTRYGGVLALMTFGMAEAGIAACDAPKPGWPVVVDFMGQQVPGLFLGDVTMLRMEGRQLVDWPGQVIGVWAL